MSYLHVDAINQQFPEDVSPEAMLIATKFAELLAKDNQMSRRVSRDRLAAMTHFKKPRLAIYLKELHERSLILMGEDPAGKKIGDRPIEYTLCLPEGFDKGVINNRRGRYYAGKPYNSRYNENFSEITVAGDRLSDVLSESVMRHRSSKSDDRSSKSDDGLLKSDDLIAKSVPINIKNTASLINNNNRGVVVDEEVEKFLEEAAKVTGGSKGSFADLVKNAQEAGIGLNVIRLFAANAVPRGGEIRNPVGYLRTLVSKAIAAGGAADFFGGISPAKVESEAEKLKRALSQVAETHLARPTFDILSAEQKTAFSKTVCRRFLNRDGNEYLRIYFDDFVAGLQEYEFTSAEELLKALDDYLEYFFQKNAYVFTPRS